jgi:hypothetical protein
MYNELAKYYQEKGIAALAFHCPHFADCSQRNPSSFTQAKEAFVSLGYVEHSLPRLVFISLDSGSAERDPAKRTQASVRVQEEEQCNVLALPRNRHWYRTHELAHTILRNFKSGLKLEDARHYFAHVNSAKCCENNPGRAQANATLFENCREFIPGELSILDPDIIVTQGSWAKLAVQAAFPRLQSPAYMPAELTEVRFFTINSHPVLWIETFHPRSSLFYTVNRPNYPQYEQLVRAFIRGAADFSIEERGEERIKPVAPHPQRRKTAPAKPAPVKKVAPKVSPRVIAGSGYVTGYLELPELPKTPPVKTPTRAQCEGYEFISMVQLCNIAEKFTGIRPPACRAFGGDNGKIPVRPERQARVSYYGRKLRKFVLVSAAADYFAEVRIDW